MLPSMPLLFICPQEQIVGGINKNTKEENGLLENLKIAHPIAENDKARDTEEGEKLSQGGLHERFDVTHFLTSEQKDNDGASLVLNENQSEKRKCVQPTGPRKRKKVDSTQKSAKETANSVENNFAESYFLKVKHILSENAFINFVTTLEKFNAESGNVYELLKQMENVLNNYPYLSNEFIGFLLPHQALECGKLTELLYLEKCWSFFKNIDAYHLNRIINALEQLSLNPTLELVRNSILSTLKGHQHFIDGLLHLLPYERPQSSSLIEYEEIRDYGGNDGDWERIRVLIHPDRGCGSNCSCPCHNKSTHILCIFCNIKFSNGHVYVQYGKVLRFARVKFDQVDPEEILKRLNPTVYDKPRRKTRSTKTHKGLMNLNAISQNIGENNRMQQNEPLGESDDVNEEDILIKQENEDFGYFDVGEYNDDVIVIEEDDDDCEDDDKMSETSSCEGDKSVDSGTGDFLFDDIGGNEEDYDGDDDDDDDIIKDINFNESSSETIDNRMLEECKGDGILVDNDESFELLEKNLDVLMGSNMYNNFELKEERKSINMNCVAELLGNVLPSFERNELFGDAPIRVENENPEQSKEKTFNFDYATSSETLICVAGVNKCDEQNTGSLSYVSSELDVDVNHVRSTNSSPPSTVYRAVVCDTTCSEFEKLNEISFIADTSEDKAETNNLLHDQEKESKGVVNNCMSDMNSENIFEHKSCECETINSKAAVHSGFYGKEQSLPSKVNLSTFDLVKSENQAYETSMYLTKGLHSISTAYEVTPSQGIPHSVEQLNEACTDVKENMENITEHATVEETNLICLPILDSSGCEEIKKDTDFEHVGDSNDTIKESCSKESSDKSKAEWTRAEDKIILEAFQKELDTEHTFSKISCNMPTRTVAEIQGRFQVLMKLLEQVASGTHDSQP